MTRGGLAIKAAAVLIQAQSAETARHALSLQVISVNRDRAYDGLAPILIPADGIPRLSYEALHELQRMANAVDV